MQRGGHVDSAPAHWACDTARLLEKAAVFTSATKQPRPQSSLLQDMGCHPVASFFNCEC